MIVMMANVAQEYGVIGGCGELAGLDRKNVVEGKSVDLGGRRIIKKKKKKAVGISKLQKNGTRIIVFVILNIRREWIKCHNRLRQHSHPIIYAAHTELSDVVDLVGEL